MYSKQEASILTQQFWTSLGQYLSPILSAEGEKINWINYKTGEKDIRFLLTADNKNAKISITLSHRDADLQQQVFDKFKTLQKKLEAATGETWEWQLHTTDQYGKIISEIYTTLTNVNVLNKTDWPGIISFFKDRLIALDSFWCQFKYAFDRSLL